MIKFEDSEITQILPGALKSLPEVKAISYAIKNAMGKLIAFSHLASVYTAIDELPEAILDLLATELRSQYYEKDMSLEVKRDILKKTLLWYYHAGTPSAVSELVESVFGEGEVLEWFDYDGKPYRFKIKTNAMMTPNMSEEFSAIIRKVKNTRSHLEAIEIERRIDQTINSGVGQTCIYKPAAVTDGYKVERTASGEIFTVAAGFGVARPAAVIDGYRVNRETSAEQTAAVTGFTSNKPAAVIDGYEVNRTASGESFIGTAQQYNTKPAAIIDGFEVEAEPVEEKHYTGTGVSSQYKNETTRE